MAVVDQAIVQVVYQEDGPSIRGVVAGWGQVVLALSAATAAAAGWTIAQAGTIDDLQKTADGLGIQVEQLQRYEHAASLAGLRQGQFTRSLSVLQRQLEAAARGSGEGLPWLQRMGIAATDAGGGVRLAADVVAEMADGLGRLGTVAERNSALQILFGGRGPDSARFANLFAGGAEGLARMGAEADALGSIVSEQLGRDAEQLTDAWTRLSAAVGGLSTAMLGDMVPALTPVVDRLTEMVSASDGLARTFAELAGSTIGAVFRGIATPAGELLATVVGISGAIGTAAVAGSLIGSISASVPAVAALGAAVGAVSWPVVGLGVAVAATTVALGTLGQTTEDVGDEMETSYGLYEDASEALGWVGDAIDFVATNSARAIGGIVGFTERIYDMTEAIRDFVGQIPQVRIMLDALGAIGRVVGAGVGAAWEAGPIAASREALSQGRMSGLMVGLDATAAGYQGAARQALTEIGAPNIGGGTYNISVQSPDMLRSYLAEAQRREAEAALAAVQARQ